MTFINISTAAAQQINGTSLQVAENLNGLLRSTVSNQSSGVNARTDFVQQIGGSTARSTIWGIRQISGTDTAFLDSRGNLPFEQRFTFAENNYFYYRRSLANAITMRIGGEAGCDIGFNTDPIANYKNTFGGEAGKHTALFRPNASSLSTMQCWDASNAEVFGVYNTYANVNRPFFVNDQFIVRDSGLNQVFTIGAGAAQVSSLWQFIVDNFITANGYTINRAGTFQKNLNFRSASLDRWRLGMDIDTNDAQFYIQRFDNAGSFIGNAVSINRTFGVFNQQANFIGYGAVFQNNGGSFTRQGIQIIAGNSNGQTQYMRWSTGDSLNHCTWSFDLPTATASVDRNFQAVTINANTDIAGLARSRIQNINNTAGTSRASLVIGTGPTANNNGVFIETILNTNGTLDNRPGGAGLPFVFRSVGVDIADYTSARWAFSVPVQMASYTLATLPAATTAAQSAYCSNLTGGPEEVFSDGTNWRRKSDRTIAN